MTGPDRQPTPAGPLARLKEAIAEGRLPAPPGERLARVLGLAPAAGHVAPDYEGAGLLDDLDGAARQARIDLLTHLTETGVPLERMQAAAAQGRLTMLPIERLFSAEATYSLEEAAERAGVDEQLLRGFAAALGVPAPEPGEAVFSDGDVESIQMLGTVLATGVPEERVLALVRIAGRAAAQTAEAVFEALRDLLLRPGDTELDLALRAAVFNEFLAPMFTPFAEVPLRMHLRERARQEVVGRAEIADGRLADAQEITVAFADLVDFTGRSDRASLTELAQLADRFDALCAEAAVPPVRLVKLIGDAGMFVAAEPADLVDAMQRLLALAAEDPVVGEIRAGIANGRALRRGGDWYGTTVNLASRITAHAPAGTLVAAASVADAVPDRNWRALGPHHVKGIGRPVELHVLRP